LWTIADSLAGSGPYSSGLKRESNGCEVLAAAGKSSRVSQGDLAANKPKTVGKTFLKKLQKRV
jgi:hypothetical protein